MANWLARAQRLTDQAPASANEVIGPALQLVKAAPTPELEQELRDLIGVILVADTDDERAEALAVALTDLDAALISFRALPGDAANSRELRQDDRRRCSDCANLTADRRCLAAWRGEQLGFGHGRNYHPVTDLLQRCIGYGPKAGEADQRNGSERWPNLARGSQQ